MNNDLFSQITQEHEEIKETLSKMISIEPKYRGDLFYQLKMALIPHMEAEEKSLYPALLDKQEAHQVSLESLEEHHIAKIVFNELSNTNPDSENWVPRCKVFKEILEHHIEEEEAEVFERTRILFSIPHIQEIFTSFLNEKNEFRKKIRA
jgi:hypothetical protein